MTKDRADKVLVWLLLAAELAFQFLYTLPLMDLNPYLLRDLDRTLQLLSGNFPLVGPDLTSGSYSPGPFFYYLLAPLLAATQKISHVMIVIFLARTASLFWFSHWLHKEIAIPRTVAFGVLAASFSVAIGIDWPNNASFILVLLPLLLFAYHRQNLVAWSILLGLATQVHASFFLLFPLPFLRLLFERSPWIKSFFVSAAIVCLTFSMAGLAWLAQWYSGEGPFPEFASNMPFLIGQLSYHLAHASAVFSTALTANRIETILLLCSTLWIFFRVKTLSPAWRAIALHTLVMAALVAPYFFAGRAARYHIVWVFLAWVVILATFSFGRVPRKAILAGSLVFFTFAKVWTVWAGPLPYSWGIPLSDLRAICHWAKERGLSYPRLMRAGFEALYADDNESSFEELRLCRLTDHPTERDHRYLIAEKYQWQLPGNPKKLLEKIPAELRNAYRAENLELEVDTGNFLVFRTRDQHDLRGTRVSNLTYAYEIDTAFPPEPQLSAAGARYFLSDAVELFETSLCPSRRFCGLFVLSEEAEGKLHAILFSRVLQTKYELTPVSARLSDLRLTYLCDGVEKSVPLASSIGIERSNEQNQTLFGPLEFTVAHTCRSAQLRALSYSAKASKTYALATEDLGPTVLPLVSRGNLQLKKRESALGL